MNEDDGSYFSNDGSKHSRKFHKIQKYLTNVILSQSFDFNSISVNRAPFSNSKNKHWNYSENIKLRIHREQKSKEFSPL